MALSYAQLEGYWIAAGGSSGTAPIAAAIALAESSGNPSAVGPSYGGDAGSIGLWQIQSGQHPQWSVDSLKDPMTNAQAAVAIYNDSGSFQPWSTFTNGAYQQFYQPNVAPTAPSGGTANNTSGQNAQGGVSDLSAALGGVGLGAQAVAQSGSAKFLAAGAIAAGGILVGIGLWFVAGSTGPGQQMESEVKGAARDLAIFMPK